MTDSNVSLIVVSYDSHDAVDAVAAAPEWAEVLVVEQHASSTVPARVRAARPQARLIRAGANRGFGAGCNLGAANATGDVLVFLNPDAVIDGSSLRALCEATLEDGAGVVGPTILDGAGAMDTRARHWSRAWIDAVHLVWPTPLMPTRWHRDIDADDERYHTGGDVPYVQGSCMAVRRDRFFAAGGFDERFFLYGEEEDLAYRLISLGCSNRLLPKAVVRHVGATSTDTVAEFATEQLFRAHLLLYRKHLGRLYAWYGAALLSTMLAVLLVSAPLRRRLPWRRRETAAWCRAALRGVAAGFRQAPVTPPPTGGADRLWADPVPTPEEATR
jgi:N-acetylglucosaminyl-diphospho-decaprenol L-rhamnosyltransferase